MPHRQEAFEVAVDRLPATARTAPDAARKSAAWKVAVATHLKSTTDVSNGWLASQLDMGTAAYVSKHVGCCSAMAVRERNGWRHSKR